VSGHAAVALESVALPGAEATDECALLADEGFPGQPAGLFAVDRTLASLCRERGPLRSVLARLASRFIDLGAWGDLGYARLSDYSVERLGLSARWVRSLALVGHAFRTFPRLEEALSSGVLGWTKVRLLASLPRGEDEAEWIARARKLTAEQLSRKVRAVDLGSLEAGALEDETCSRLFEVRCSPEVRFKWYAARGAASRVAGRMVRLAEAAELIAAEVLSAIPVDEQWTEEACDTTGASRTELDEPVDKMSAPDSVATRPPRQGYGELEALMAELEHADAFELDARLRRALAIEQRLDARMGPLLFRVWGRWMHRSLGYRTREAYARERLGMDPTRARALVRLERAATASEPFARAYRSGALSWVKAGLLVPLVSADPLGRFMEDWVAWAGRVTVRRLREDVEWALTLEDTDPAAFRKMGGLPAEARGEAPSSDREIGAPDRDPRRDMVPPAARENSRNQTAETCTACFIGPAEVVQLLRAILCTVRRRLERDDGRMPTEGEALGAVLDYVFACWGVGKKAAAHHRVFERDGWLCAVPGCTSMQNLHDHHIQFRSAGGSDELGNRVTLCAFHHLRGVHANRLRCVGRAPDGLTWQIGIRPGAAPLAAYASGDRQVERA
jgi:hypothetical protein